MAGKTKKEKVDLTECYLMGNKPPQALDVEAAVLGAMLMEPSIIDEIMEKLTPSCFYDPKYRMIFEAMTSLVKEHFAIDLISVSEKLRNQGNLESVGGTGMLVELSQNIGAAAHIVYYIKILKQKTIQRDLITASYKIIKESFDEMAVVDNLIGDAERMIHEAAHPNEKSRTETIDAAINNAMANLQKRQSVRGPAGVPSGYPSIDRVTGGWQNSTLTVIGGDTSVGKTAFALNIARNAAVDHNVPVAYFSLGMVTERITRRLVTTESGLSGEKIRGGMKLEPSDWEQLEYTLKRLSNSPLYIDDTPDLTTSQFASKAMRMAKKNGIRLIIVDCIQQMRGPRELRDNRIQETAAIVRTLKTTATKLGIPIVAISQLSRDIPKNANFLVKPHLYDLRDSGTIENNADMVIFIHRPAFSGMSEDPADREKALFIIAKNSDGETCDIELKYKSRQMKFVEPDWSLDIQLQRPYVSAASEPVNTDDGYNFEDPDKPF